MHSHATDKRIQIDTDKAELTALLQWASNDNARTIHHPAINCAAEIAATDGHTAIVVGREHRPSANDWRVIPRGLLETAIKAQPAKGSIEIASRVGSDDFTITVRDKQKLEVITLHGHYQPGWPPLANVWPSRPSAPNRAALNPEYLARFAKVCKAIGMRPEITIVPASGRDPWHITAVPRDGSRIWSAIVMPIDRCDCPVPGPAGDQ